MDQALARLERVTERLERLEAARTAGASPSAAGPQSRGVAAAAPAAPSHAATDAKPPSNGPPAAGSWPQLLQSYLPPLVQATGSLTDPEVQAAFQPFKQAFEAVGPVLQATGNTKRPDAAGVQSILAPVAVHMMELGKKTEGRRSNAYNHVKAMSESLNALSWLAYDGPSCGLSPPPQHVAEAWQSAEFFTTRVLKEFKDKGGEAHAAWVRALRDLMVQLQAFVEAHFPQGPTWGVPKAAATAPAAAAAPAPPRASGGPPPPPPPPGAPPPPLSVAKIQSAPGGGAAAAAAGGEAGGGGGMTALFKELASANLTSGLKRVTDDMKTKNRADRTAVVTMPEPAAAAAAAGGWKAGGGGGAAGGKGGAGGGVPTGTPALELRDRKWYAEYQTGKRDLVIEATDSRQSVYVYACKDCVVKIKGKVNNISIDSCVKTGVMFEDVIASCEVVNSKSIQMQADGHVPTLSVEKTDGCQMYLNKRLTQDPNFQIVTAKCSSMNVVVMAGPDEDPMDVPIPEQFVSSFQNGQLVTVAASHSGA